MQFFIIQMIIYFAIRLHNKNTVAYPHCQIIKINSLFFSRRK